MKKDLRRKISMALLTVAVLTSGTLNVVYSKLLIAERHKHDDYREVNYQPPLTPEQRGLSKMEAMKRLSGRRPLPQPDR